jgi:hypothetical protein
MRKVNASSRVSGPDDESGRADQKRRDKEKGKEQEFEDVCDTWTKEAEGDLE